MVIRPSVQSKKVLPAIVSRQSYIAPVITMKKIKAEYQTIYILINYYDFVYFTLSRHVHIFTSIYLHIGDR